MARYLDYKSLPVPEKADPEAEFTFSITKILTDFPPLKSYDRHSCQGLYSGPTSIAYLFHRLSKVHPKLCIADKPLGYWCRIYLNGKRPETAVAPNRCGIANETLAHIAVQAAEFQNDAHVDDFLTHIPFVLNGTPTEASNEWLYGRAGVLYFLRLVRHDSCQLHQQLDDATNAVIDKILTEGPPWPWHGKEYLGAAHGSIGILTQIILSAPSMLPRLASIVDDLLSRQDAQTGNWPSSAMSTSQSDRLIQFCHGAPGFVISLLAIRPYVVQQSTIDATASTLLARIDPSVNRARSLIATRGLLTKQPSLCHGVVGNALALKPGDEREVFMRWCTAGMIEKGLKERWYVRGDDEWGLFCGEAGRAWGWGMEWARKQGKGVEMGLIGYVDV